jgi:hypothetical protein
MASASVSRAFPGFSSLYLFTEDGGSKHFRADIALRLGEAFAVPRGEVKPHQPVPAKWMMGRTTPADIIWTGSVAPVLVSDLVVSLLKEHGFTGWRIFRVALSGKSGEEIAGYQGLVVSGRCGPIDNAQSRKVDKIFPGGAFRVWKGLYFDRATWDGSHLFMPAGNVGWIFVVDAVKETLEKAKVKNVLFTPLDEVERMKL